MQIDNGAGDGSSLRVDKQNRAHTYSVTKPEDQIATLTGNRYNINTGDITLTSANASSVLYVKNNDPDGDLVVTAAIYNLGTSTGGSGDVLIDILRNPDAGTVVSDASAVSINSNSNFGSAKILTVDAYKGGEGKTLTGGTTYLSTRSNSLGRILISLGSINIPRGSSIGIKITPQASNTSMIIQAAFSCFLRTVEVSGD